VNPVCKLYTIDLLIRCKQADMGDCLKQVDVYENELPTAVQQTIHNWPSSLSHAQDREADSNALACLNCALDKKVNMHKFIIIAWSILLYRIQCAFVYIPF
jgi:hypothetical protein